MIYADRPLKLLLIDDDPDMVRLLKAVIGRDFRGQLEIESLTDPAIALERIDQGGIEILLTDLEMPNVNGLELLRRAKGRNAFTQVLFLTGHSTQDALLEAFEFGASDYLLKPVDQQQLLELLGQAYSRQKRWQLALAGTWRQQKEASAASAS